MILEQHSRIPGVDMPRGLLRRLVLLSALLAAVVNCGDLGSIDARRRLQQARALWSGEPEVRAEESAVFPRSAGGTRRSFYGAGQALLFLPADVAASPLSRLFPDPRVSAGARIVIVAWLTQTIVTAWALVFAYLLLRRLGFSHPPALLGALSLPLATTFLHYIQVCQENNLLLAAALSGSFFAASWLDTGRRRHALLAGVCFGFGYFTRLTSAADTAGGLIFLSAAWMAERRHRRPMPRLSQFALWFAPGFALFIFLERCYFASRFGSWTGTILTVMAPDTGFTNPLWAGVRTALFSDLSLFLFDPLLLPALTLLAAVWHNTLPRLRAFAAGSACTLAFYVVFYARFFTPTGQSAWGDRYTQTPVHLLCLLAVPLLWSHRQDLHTWTRRVTVLLIGWSFVLQLASVMLNMSVEVDQAARFPEIWRIPQRFANLWIVLRGQAGSSAVLNFLPPEWQRLNLLPFQLALRFPVLAAFAMAAWAAALAAAALLAARLISSTVPAGTSASAALRKSAATPLPSEDADAGPDDADTRSRR